MKNNVRNISFLKMVQNAQQSKEEAAESKLNVKMLNLRKLVQQIKLERSVFGMILLIHVD